VPRLAPAWVVLAFGLAQANAVIDWDASRRMVLAMPADARSLAQGLTLLAWLTTCRAPLADVLLGPRLAFARRSSLSDRQFAALAGALAAVAVAPWALLWARLTDPVYGAGLLLAALPAALSGVGRSRMWLVSALAAARVAGDGSAVLMAPICLTMPWLWADRRDPPAVLAPRGVTWPSTPIGAFVARDLVAAWRTRPGLAAEMAMLVALVTVASVALRANGDPTPGFTGPAASLAAGMGVGGASGLLVAARRALGGAADEPELPLSPAARAAVHALVCAVGWAGCGVVVALWGPGAAPDRLLRVAAMGAAVAALTPAVTLSGDRLKREHTGPLLWAMVALGALALLPTAGSVAASLALAAGAQAYTTWGLRRAREAR
jgi:hypothetical protein